VREEDAAHIQKKAASIHRWHARYPDSGGLSLNEAARLDSYAHEIRTLKHKEPTDDTG